jgi:hypothetical protein
MAIAKWRLVALKTLRRRVQWEGASFGDCAPTAVHGGGHALPTHEGHVDAFIRERTRLYVKTWILPIIDCLIDGDYHRAKDLLIGLPR